MREEAGVRHTTWRYELAAQARLAMQDAGLVTPYREPIYVALHFTLHRPASHYGTGKNSERLAPRAPLFPSKPPDIDKLTRAVLDSMTSIVWVDDAQVVRLTATKGFVHRWQEEGVSINVATYEREDEPSPATIPS
jgi:Holliday junction resolvase RusA-like endonuclease